MLRYKYLILAIICLSMFDCSCSGQPKRSLVTGYSLNEQPKIPNTPTTQQPAFEYVDVFLPENTGAKPCLLSKATSKLNRVDNEWGIWGHNIEKVLGGDLPDETYALVDGERNRSQLCFSSAELYKKLSAWIIDNYGTQTTSSFCIFPKDNKLACTCHECTKKGNTQGNATPAVTDFICRLCRQFPMHRFYTSFYHSTSELPSAPLPQNAGVIVSAYTWQLRNAENAASEKFKATVKQWAEYTDRIYVWDYINNFEDYFTPFPIVALMQQRIRFYANAGVKGIFFNGSGYDYSSFSDMKTYALAELCSNPDADWKMIIKTFFNKYYPSSAKLLSDFCISIEQRALQRKKALNLYAAVDEALIEYLDEKEFIAFYDSLDIISNKAKDIEAIRLKNLLSAITLTRLEIAKMRGEKMQIPEIFYHTPSKVYSEEGWLVQDYINQLKEKGF